MIHVLGMPSDAKVLAFGRLCAFYLAFFSNLDMAVLPSLHIFSTGALCTIQQGFAYDFNFNLG